MELSLLGVVSLIFLITAVGSVINHRFMKWPNTIAVMLLSTILSILLYIFQSQDIVKVIGIERIVQKVQFSELLLHWLLPVLLFAGSLHVPVVDLKKYRFQILTFATVGVVLSATILGGLISWVAPHLGFQITFLQAAVFGVLISSTDPVCALGILNKGKISKSLKAKITGESLFNDGTAVVLFLTLVTVAFNPEMDQNLDYRHIAQNFFYEFLGGIAVGLVCAFLASLLTVMVDAYDIEIMITLALAFGTYALAEALHVSAPIAVVVAGLYIGNRTVKKFMSDKSREHVNTFWHLIDDTVNSVLFVLMGLVLILFHLDWPVLVLSGLTIVFMLLARYLSIIGSATTLVPLKLVRLIDVAIDFKKMPVMMTWCGLRGGISIALALSIPDTLPEVKKIILTMTFFCVFFSVLIQGLTLPKFLKYIGAEEMETETNNINLEVPEPKFDENNYQQM